MLEETYAKLNAGPKGKIFEVVFVSSDHNETEFNEYFRSKPWTAMPYAENKYLLYSLQSKLRASSIPALVILEVSGDAEFRILDREGRSSVQAAKGDVRKLLLSWGMDHQLDEV